MTLSRLFALCLAGMSLAAHAQGNLVPNSSFEAGADPASWGVTSQGYGLLGEETLDTGTAAHGKTRGMSSTPSPVPS